MNCEEIRNTALLVSFGEAGEAEAAAVRAHAGTCAACAAEIRTLREGLDLLQHAPKERPSRDARAALGGLLLREAPRPQLAGRRPRVLRFAAAAAVLVGAVSVFAWKSQQQATVPVPQPETKPVAQVTKKTLPPLDPALAWDADHDTDVGYIAIQLATLAPSSASSPDSDAFLDGTDPLPDNFDDLDDSLDSLQNELNKL